ncbi:MAG: site-specific integrase [Bacteroidota bacterium]
MVNNKDANELIIDLCDDDKESPKKITDRLFRAIRYACQKAGQKFNEVSPYSFRHQVASDLKKEGHDQEKIAAFLGHRTVRMQQNYGFRGQGKGSTGIVKVDASHDIKPAAEPLI